jgi:hypothetical protein
MHTKKRQEAVPPSARIDLAFERKYNHVKTDPPKRQKNDTERHRTTKNNKKPQKTTNQQVIAC